MDVQSSSELNDKKVGAVVSVSTLLLVFLLLYISTIQSNKTKTSSIVLITDIPLEAVQETKTVIPVDEQNGGGGGGGTPSDDKVDPTPRPQTEEIVTSKSSSAVDMTSGKSNKTTDENSQNTATSVKKSTNPFGDGGNGSGEGGGVGKGKGIGFGNDNGSGSGSGSGNGAGGGNGNAKRIRLNDPNVDNIQSDANHKINLRVKIDADGNVLSATSTSRTTTTDQSIISKVISATVNQVKYNKKPGSGVEEQFISISIRAK